MAVLLLFQIHGERLTGLKTVLFQFSEEKSGSQETDAFHGRQSVRHKVYFSSPDLYPCRIKISGDKRKKIRQFFGKSVFSFS